MFGEYENIKVGDKIQIKSKEDLIASGIGDDAPILNLANQILTIDEIKFYGELAIYKVKETDIVGNIKFFDADFINLTYREKFNELKTLLNDLLNSGIKRDELTNVLKELF